MTAEDREHWERDVNTFFSFGLAVGFLAGMAIMAAIWFYVTLSGGRPV